MKSIAAIAILLLSACSYPCKSNVYAGGWCVEGDAPPAFLAEIDAAANAIGHHGNDRTLTVRPWPFSCGDISPRTGLCTGGASMELGDIEVVYDPTVGLGPAVGSTALEHEICHFVVGHDEDAADACASAALPAIKKALGQ